MRTALYRNTQVPEISVKKCIKAFRGGICPRNPSPPECGHDVRVVYVSGDDDITIYQCIDNNILTKRDDLCYYT